MIISGTEMPGSTSMPPNLKPMAAIRVGVMMLVTAYLLSPFSKTRTFRPQSVTRPKDTSLCPRTCEALMVM